MPAGLLEVVADRLLELAARLAGRLLEPAGIALVQLRPRLLRHALVGCLADERVAKAKCLLARRVRWIGAQELLAHEREDQLRQAICRPGGEERGDRRQREALTDDGRALERLAFLRLEGIEAGGEQRLDRGRDRDLLVTCGSLARMCEQLLEEERVPLRRLDDPPPGRFRQVGAAKALEHEL